jgi:hypothetical protein
MREERREISELSIQQYEPEPVRTSPPNLLPAAFAKFGAGR